MDSTASSASPRVAIGIATRGRASVLATTIPFLQRQDRPADRILVCYTTPADIAGLDHLADVEWLLEQPGLPRQRNAIIKSAGDCDIVVFFDDDFLATPGYIGSVVDAMAGHHDIVATTGDLIADGIIGPGLPIDAGMAMISSDQGNPKVPEMVNIRNAYGCNMALRLATIREHNMAFDENLPLYGWLEDLDFTRQIHRFGRIVRLRSARGVHLGVKSGRTSGVKLGYSQVANPLYIAAKGRYALHDAIVGLSRNIAANVARLPWPESYIDRRGRLSGNLLALFDLIRGKMDPRRILEL